MAANEIDPEVRDSPVYWFAVLITAKDRNYFECAAECQRELKRLGVDVKFRRAFRQQRGASHAL